MIRPAVSTELVAHTIAAYSQGFEDGARTTPENSLLVDILPEAVQLYLIAIGMEPDAGGLTHSFLVRDYRDKDKSEEVDIEELVAMVKELHESRHAPLDVLFQISKYSALYDTLQQAKEANEDLNGACGSGVARSVLLRKETLIFAKKSAGPGFLGRLFGRKE